MSQILSSVASSPPQLARIPLWCPLQAVASTGAPWFSNFSTGFRPPSPLPLRPSHTRSVLSHPPLASCCPLSVGPARRPPAGEQDSDATAERWPERTRTGPSGLRRSVWWIAPGGVQAPEKRVEFVGNDREATGAWCEVMVRRCERVGPSKMEIPCRSAQARTCPCYTADRIRRCRQRERAQSIVLTFGLH